MGLAVSLITATASHFLFRPKPVLLPTQNTLTDTTEERTFSFEGIRTAIGPGGVVPVVYGRHRIGGQLLAAAVDQAYVIVDDGGTGVGRPITNVTYVVPNNLVLITAPEHGFVTNQNVRLEGIVGKPALNATWIVQVVDVHTFLLLFSWDVDIEQPVWRGWQRAFGDVRPAHVPGHYQSPYAESVSGAV